jgi:6-phospho-3-hexuloisomerase
MFILSRVEGLCPYHAAETTVMSGDLAIGKILDEVRQALEGIGAQEAQDFISALAGARKVFVTGQGRSGLMVSAFAIRLAHLGKGAHIVGSPTAPPVGPGELLVACSGSGRTRCTVLHAEQALAAGAQVWAITQEPSSPLVSAATRAIFIPALRPAQGGPEHSRGAAVPSVQPGGSAFEQGLLIFLDAIILGLMAQLGETEDTMLARHANLE